MTSTAAPPDGCIELTGYLGASDNFGRLVLIFVDRLQTPGWGRVADQSWYHLVRSVPSCRGDRQVPYKKYDRSRAGPLGFRGECKITLGRAAAKKKRVLALAEKLLNQEVVVTVKPQDFIDRDGNQRSLLRHVYLERLEPK